MPLLDKLKDKLRILDNDEDLILEDILERGKENLNHLVGIELDFDRPSLAQTLLLEQCRYEYNNALEYFEENFYKELNRLIFSVAVKENEKDKTETT